ncbi:MAG: hypothetical protein ACFHU9_10070 [Fluviicola sp.]
MDAVEDIFWSTPICKYFEEIASDENMVLVKKLVSDCVPILDRIVQTFPTYTLHNGQHQLNILNLYSKLLGEKIKNLSELEAAILILTAFYHDIGMVYSEKERQNLANEELFKEFIESEPSARLIYAEANEIRNDLAEWYCRWAHAKRVWVYLDELNDSLVWEGNNFRKELAHVCLSHNEDTKYIDGDDIPSNFWGDADLKFCAILLRLADILDFDNSRSPESVFKYLNLSNQNNSSAEVSFKEWSKHLASKGFDFDEWSKDVPYKIYFKATPNHPAVENDILSFLDIIEHELQKCRTSLNFCSEKWRGFVLPEKIDRTHIYSQGYTSGAYKFSLDQKQVMNLLMGESLYENSYIFIRELVQNAIDTSRHREKHEQYIIKSNYTCRPVEFSSWEDTSGYKWIRIDDHGMGMSLKQIEKFFLKIGNSFYNSDDFKVSKLAYPESEKRFTPVSKFGIGILSCFMVSDVIEVSSKSIYCNSGNENPVRLSMNGIDNYYFLYTKDDIPKEMPNKGKVKEGYRSEVGTSIALRLNPNFDRKEFDIHNILERLIYSSQVPIKYVGNTYGEEKVMDIPFEKQVYKIPSEQVERVKEFIDNPEIKEINPEIHLVPVKLSDKGIQNAEGLLLTFLLRMNVTYTNDNWERNRSYTRRVEWNFKFDTYHTDEPPKFELKIKKPDTLGRSMEMAIPLNPLIEKIKEFNGNIKYNAIRDEVLLSHNGILIPNNPSYKSDGAKLRISIRELDSDLTFCLGIVNLKDELRPNLDVARSKIISFPWNCYSQINLLLRRSLRKTEYQFKSQVDHIDNYSMKVDYNRNDVEKDPFLIEPHGWLSEFDGEGSELSIQNIKESSPAEVEVYGRFGYSLSDFIFRKVIFNHAEYKIKLFRKLVENQETKESKYVLREKAYLIKPKKFESHFFPSHFTCIYEGFDGLMPEELNSSLYNIEHPFTQWLSRVYSILHRDYYYHLRRINEARNIEDINEVLEKLDLILPEKQRPNLVLTEKDFEIDFDKLPDYS